MGKFKTLLSEIYNSIFVNSIDFFIDDIPTILRCILFNIQYDNISKTDYYMILEFMNLVEIYDIKNDDIKHLIFEIKMELIKYKKYTSLHTEYPFSNNIRSELMNRGLI